MPVEHIDFWPWPCILQSARDHSPKPSRPTRECALRLAADTEWLEMLLMSGPIGKAARRLGLSTVGPVSLEFGWAPRHGSTSEATWLVGADGRFDAPGTYGLTFRFRRGKSGLTVRGVTLLDGDQVIAKDLHEGFAGRKSRANTYRLIIAKPAKNPVLRITCQTGPDTNSSGTFDLQVATDKK